MICSRRGESLLNPPSGCALAHLFVTGPSVVTEFVSSHNVSSELVRPSHGGARCVILLSAHLSAHRELAPRLCSQERIIWRWSRPCSYLPLACHSYGFCYISIALRAAIRCAVIVGFAEFLVISAVFLPFRPRVVNQLASLTRSVVVHTELSMSLNSTAQLPVPSMAHVCPFQGCTKGFSKKYNLKVRSFCCAF